MSYNVSSYAAMIDDRIRVEAYLEAMRRTIKPGDVVVELGTGIGFFAVMACRLGARRIYAIEPNDAIHVARELAAANGCADRIEFIQDLSTNVTLPEPADVMLSDLRGVLPLFSQHIPSIVDARRRLLKPEGVLIPQRDVLWAAVVESPELYRRQLAMPDAGEHDFDWRPVRRIVVNNWGKGRVTTEQILLPAQPFASLDYASVQSADLSSELHWIADRAGTAHGVSVWFDATLVEGVTFSNSPVETELVYGSAFFPFSEPVAIAAGDEVAVVLQADLVSDDYVWRWNTTVKQGEKIKAAFQQSTFFGAPLSPSQLRRGSSEFQPTLNEDGQIAQFIIERMARRLSVGEIADQVLAQFPTRFANRQNALTHVGALAQQYSR